MTTKDQALRSGRFTKKPVTIDAWRIALTNPEPDWVRDAFALEKLDWCPAGEGLYISTLEGHMKGDMGDWLIRGVKGELYACKPDIFEATYAPAALQSAPSGFDAHDMATASADGFRAGQAALSERAEVVACRELTDADMDQIAAWMGQQERGDIGFHALCENIIRAFATHPTQQPDAQAYDARAEVLLGRLEDMAHRKGALWERCQGKGWPNAESDEFTKLRDTKLPDLRKKLLALMAQQPAPQPVDADTIRRLWKGLHTGKIPAAPQPVDERGALLGRALRVIKGLIEVGAQRGVKPTDITLTIVADLEKHQGSAAHSQAPQAREWQPIDTAPKDGTEVLAWREDCGQFIALYTSPDSFPFTEAEIDLMEESWLFQKDWFTQWPASQRLEGTEVPTHWMPLPTPPETTK